MDDAAVIVLMFFFGVMLLAAVGLGAWLGTMISDRRYDNRLRTLIEEPDDYDGPVIDAETVEERGPVALPVDPNNPPTWRIARKDRDDVLCNCHSKPVKAGERLLFWPMGDGVMRVYHEDATEAAGQ